MYKVLLVLASAAALKGPQRALAVRGGELGLNAETAINVGTGLMGVAGAYTVIDPAGNIEKYGISKPDASAVNMMAWAGGWQVALAAIYAADAEKAVGLSGYIAAWTLLAQSRVSDVMGGPKASTYIWTAICAALGYKTLRDDLSPWPLVAVWTLNGVQQHFMRDQCLEMYGCNKQSALGKAMMGVSGQSMLMGAAYLIALTKGKTQAEAFGISWAVGGALVTKFALTEADDLKVPKTGPLVWAVISAGIAYACLK